MHFHSCAFMLDAMSIKQQWGYDQRQHKRTGGVDLGNGPDSNEDSSNLASEAMVFMLVGK